MRKVFDVNETFGHEYYNRIDEQIAKWDNEPIEIMMEMEIAEQVEEEEEMRKEAYRKIAEYLWRKGAPADVYEQWLDICIKRGAL